MIEIEEAKMRCKCGCGKEIKSKTARLIRGHADEEMKMKISKSRKGMKFSIDHKRNLSESRKGKKHWFYGKKFSKETKKKISKALKGNKNFLGKKHSEKTKRKISNSLIGKKHPLYRKTGNNHNRYGKKFSDISREKSRKSRLKYIEKTKFKGLPLIPTIGKHETHILDSLENMLGYKIIRQHKVAGYFLDGYCPMLKLAIEVDESYHKKQIEKDLRREREIQEKLNCNFFRIDLTQKMDGVI